MEQRREAATHRKEKRKQFQSMRAKIFSPNLFPFPYQNKLDREIAINIIYDGSNRFDTSKQIDPDRE